MTGEELRTFRESLGLSAPRFAQALQIGTARSVYRWEAGEYVIPPEINVLLDLVAHVPAARKRLKLPTPK